MTIDPTRFTDWTDVHVGDTIVRKGKRYEILKLDGSGWETEEGITVTMRGDDGVIRAGKPRDYGAPVRILDRPPAAHVTVAELAGVEPAAVAEVLARVQLGATPIAERISGGFWSCPPPDELDADPAALAAHLLFFHGGVREHPALDALHGRFVHHTQSGPTVEHVHDRISIS